MYSRHFFYSNTQFTTYGQVPVPYYYLPMPYPVYSIAGNPPYPVPDAPTWLLTPEYKKPMTLSPIQFILNYIKNPTPQQLELAKKVLIDAGFDFYLTSPDKLAYFCRVLFNQPFESHKNDVAIEIALSLLDLVSNKLIASLKTPAFMQSFLPFIINQPKLLEKTLESILASGNTDLFTLFFNTLKTSVFDTSSQSTIFNPYAQKPYRTSALLSFSDTSKAPMSHPEKPLKEYAKNEAIRRLFYGNPAEKAYFNPLVAIAKSGNIGMLRVYKDAMVELFDALNDPEQNAATILGKQAQSLAKKLNLDKKDDKLTDCLNRLANRDLHDIHSIDWLEKIIPTPPSITHASLFPKPLIQRPLIIIDDEKAERTYDGPK